MSSANSNNSGKSCWSRLLCGCGRSHGSTMPDETPSPPAVTVTTPSSSDTPEAPSTPAESGPPPPPKTPAWVDNAFLETALRSEHPGLVVTSMEVEPAVMAGENYACVVFRAVVHTSSHGEFKLILKCIPEAEVRAQFVLSSGITAKEIDMYKRALPLLRGGLSSPHFPHCYYAVQDDKHDTLVLQDMKPLGFRTRQRQLGIDLAHCRLALKELAHLHGLSIALRIQHPEVFEREIRDKFHDSFYTEKSKEKMEPFTASMFTSLADAIEFRLPYRFQAIAQLLKDWVPTVYDDMIAMVMVPQDPEEIVVLNHGDFWCNNMLFQYKEEQEDPVGCAMIDFQISRCASPVLDLLYFFYSSTTQALRRAHMEELLELYLREVRRTLAERGVVHTPPNRFFRDVQHLKEEMRRHAMFGFIMGIFVVPIVIADAKDAPDMDSFTLEDIEKMNKNPFLKMYAGPLFCARMSEILEDFDDMGFCTEMRTILKARHTAK